MKSKGGNFTKYKPEYCQQATDLMAEGFSMFVVAGKFNVSRWTLNKWIEAHEEFKTAIDIGKAKAAAKWERRLGKIADEGGGNGSATMVAFALKNLAKETWQDKQTVETTGKDGGPIETVTTVEYRIVDAD